MNYRNQNLNGKLKTYSLLFALTPVLAQAHPGHGQAAGFVGGLSHPFLGADHILAMVALGLWAAQIGGRALWALPVAFVSLMTVGGFMGMAGVPVPMVEAGILLSVPVLGFLLMFAARPPLAAGLALAGLFAIFHGHAHGAEVPAAASGMLYVAGFALATAALHGLGIAVGLLARRQFSAPLLRYAGAAIVVGGFCLWLA